MQKYTTLNKLKLNTYAKVIEINCSGSERRRFLDLGIIKGTKIRPIFKSPLGDPTAYEIRKTVIALREEDSEKIKVLET
ncbi:MAG: ferrous iron transport protein A [Oscillospiraceae bacterium]|nr:ferrous iron transport protein A [Oscillospiraceae bacterium]